MISDFEYFGDVSCFDTTHRKHKDGRPIALFVGVNHHKQTVVFGVALLYDETIPSFMWLFDTFSKAMDGKRPETILTDQDAAMANALASQWPNTYHRLCIWHIFQNAAIHLSHVFSKFKDFSRDFSTCVYDYEHEDDFINVWDDMLIKYDLQDNDWLKRMFNNKEKWALVYGRDTFCADRTTTQRSESMKKVIKHYVSYKHDLRRLFLHFDRLLNNRRYNERMTDFKADQSEVVSPFPIQILKHAASVYTPAILKLFQQELSKSYDCIIAEHIETKLHSMYIVCPFQKHYRYNVTYDRVEDTILCTCRKFEFGGLLCSHILQVLSTRGITQIPMKYILKRWTKGTKNGSVMSKNKSMSDADPKTIAGRRYRDLCRLGTRLSARAAENEDDYLEVQETLIMLIGRIWISTKTMKDQHAHSNSCIRHEDDNVVIDSTGSKKIVKGIKAKPRTGNSSKRPKGALEGAIKSRRTKQKSTSKVDKVLPSSQISEIGHKRVTQPISQTSSSINLSIQHEASHHIHTYQALLGIDYPDAENLMHELIAPNDQPDKALSQHGREGYE